MKNSDTVSVSIGLNSESKDLNERVNVPSLLGLPLASLSPHLRFIVCSLAVFVFYVLYGFMLELVFHVPGIQPHGWFITLIQFFYYSLFALAQLAVSGMSIKTKVPLRTYLIIASLTVGTMGFSNSSMGYLNYPTQVIFKSCKLIPVMIGSVIILRKTYNFAQVLACITMCAGLVWFTLADSTLQPDFNLQGVFLVSMSLCCDAIIGNVQEAALKSSHEPSARLVLYSYGIGLVLIAALLTMSGSLLPGGTFVMENWWDVVPSVLVLSASGFCGVQAVLALVVLHGALMAVTVTTARKALSILLSFMLFTKPFTIQYVWGGALVAAGIYLNVLAKQKQSRLAQALNNGYAQVGCGVHQLVHSFVRRLTFSPSSRHPSAALLKAWARLRASCRGWVGAKPSHQFRFDV